VSGDTLPVAYTFTASDHGKHAFQVTFSAAGSDTLTATDKDRQAQALERILLIKQRLISSTGAGFDAFLARGLLIWLSNDNGGLLSRFLGSCDDCSAQRRVGRKSFCNQYAVNVQCYGEDQRQCESQGLGLSLVPSSNSFHRIIEPGLDVLLHLAESGLCPLNFSHGLLDGVVRLIY